MRYTTDSYRRAIHRACDKTFPHPELSKLKAARADRSAEGTELRQWQSEHRWSPNQLRHTAATEIRSKFGLEAAQVILGHSSGQRHPGLRGKRDIAKANRGGQADRVAAGLRDPLPGVGGGSLALGGHFWIRSPLDLYDGDP